MSGQPLQQADVFVRIDTGGFGGGNAPERVRRTAKLFEPELGRRLARQRNDGTIAVPVTEEEAAELDVGTLVVPPNSRHPDGSPYAFKVVGQEEERCELGSDDAGDLRRGTYVMLRLAVPAELVGAVDAPSVGSPPPKSVAQPEKPVVDPDV